MFWDDLVTAMDEGEQTAISSSDNGGNFLVPRRSRENGSAFWRQTSPVVRVAQCQYFAVKGLGAESESEKNE